MAVDPKTAGPIEKAARELLNCMCIALGEAGWEGTCCLEPGTATWEGCEDEGKAWARLIEVFPVSQYPLRTIMIAPDNATTTWGALYELGATTAICLEDCDCEVREANTRLVMNMAQAALEGIACCADVGDLRLGGLQMVGPESTCVGFTIQAMIQVDVCCP